MAVNDLEMEPIWNRVSGRTGVADDHLAQISSVGDLVRQVVGVTGHSDQLHSPCRRKPAMHLRVEDDLGLP